MKGGRKRSRHASTSEDPADRHERLHASTRRGDHIAATQAVEASAPSPSPSATPVEAPLATPAPSATPVGAPSATPAPSATRAPAELDPAPLSPMAELPRQETSSSEPSGEESSSSSELSGEEEEPLILQEEIDAADVMPDVVPEGGADDDLIQRVAPFPGGPEDLSLLAHYPDHKAPWTWQALLRTDPRYVDRRTLRVATVGGRYGTSPVMAIQRPTHMCDSCCSRRVCITCLGAGYRRQTQLSYWPLLRDGMRRRVASTCRSGR
ncbi:uncharacterized protein LOC130731542 isoform X2 [Lotus japonicus]|nr:uncharacterized protein LOC130731542 isoform X2 [Lotus japonicus]